MPTKLKSGEMFKISFDYSRLFKGLDQYHEDVIRTTNATALEIALDGWGRLIMAAPLLWGFLRGSHTAAVNGHQIAGIINGIKHGKKVGKGAFIVWAANAKYAASRHRNPKEGTRGGAGLWFVKVIPQRHPIWMQLWANNLKAMQRQG